MTESEATSGDDEAFDREELVRTVRMEAFDRHQLELLDAVRKWTISAHLRDQRFAPDVLVLPPRVLTKKWQEALSPPSPVVPDSRDAVAQTVQTKTITDEDIARAAIADRPSEPHVAEPLAS